MHAVLTASSCHAAKYTYSDRQTLIQAYGPDGLGILLVAGVPELPELRQQLLPLAQRFAVRTAAPRHAALQAVEAGRSCDVCCVLWGKCSDRLWWYAWLSKVTWLR